MMHTLPPSLRNLEFEVERDMRYVVGYRAYRKIRRKQGFFRKTSETEVHHEGPSLSIVLKGLFFTLKLGGRVCIMYLYLQVKAIRFMVFNATFNNIIVMSWRSVLLVE
jgi:hypothetical protein